MSTTRRTAVPPDAECSRAAGDVSLPAGRSVSTPPWNGILPKPIGLVNAVAARIIGFAGADALRRDVVCFTSLFTVTGADGRLIPSDAVRRHHEVLQQIIDAIPLAMLPA